jgi:AcrR family transcriptional regulator
MNRPALPPVRVPNDSTAERIVLAARDVFAKSGIAGARVDVIAKQARTSKERVYAYFRSKEALYEHIAEREMQAVADATHLDAEDLPAYAGRVFEYFSLHPESFRLISWGRLEVPLASHPLPDNPSHRSTLAKIEKIREAQRAGRLDTRWEPLDVLAIVNQIATAWQVQIEMVPFIADHARDTAPSARKAAVIKAVATLFPVSSTKP